jgi:hypothetical protein
LQSIGDQWGLCRERVRQIINQALEERGVEVPSSQEIRERRNRGRDREIITKMSMLMKGGLDWNAAIKKMCLSKPYVNNVFHRNDEEIPRHCVRCGANLPSRKRKWCEKCAIEMKKYENWSPEKKKSFSKLISGYNKKRRERQRLVKSV